jgi:MerR family transcriptional regulator/heat shock protein HspR
MTAELGMNLAGVERVFELEEELQRMARRMEALERRAQEVRQEMQAQLERVRREFRAEIVPYVAPGEALIPARQARGFRIPVQHPGRSRRRSA